MSRSKVVHTPDGTFIVDEDDISSFDPASMIETPSKPTEPDESLHLVVVDGKEYRGKIIKYSVLEDKVSGKTRVRLVLDV